HRHRGLPLRLSHALGVELLTGEPLPPAVYVDPWLPVYVPDIVDVDLDLDVDIPVPGPPGIGPPGIGRPGGTEYRASWTSTPTSRWRWAWRWATLGRAVPRPGRSHASSGQ